MGRLKKHLALLFLFYIQHFGVSGEQIIGEGPIVTVKQGQLQGAIIEGVLGKPYIAFKGIPFAAPPLGELRFKDPEPPASWSGIRNASKYVQDVCAQVFDFPPNKIVGSEDCLYLNVYTTSINETKPVMVWIHGGAFISGTGADRFASPDYLVGKDVLLVTINYRLGAFGFLNLGHEVAAGNQGYKDQVAALQWVKENIAVFGGDPNNVTIFGESAGGAAIHTLCLSRMARGLFHRAISQSGVALHPWTLNRSKPERFYQFAKLVGSSSSDPAEIVEYLRTVPIEKIIKAQIFLIMLSIVQDGFSIPFALAVDTVSKNPFFPEPIEEAIKNDTGIPLMIGHNSYEFIIFMDDTSPKALELIVDSLEMFVRGSVRHVPPKNIPKLTEAIKKYYFGDGESFNITAKRVVSVLSDLYFVKDVNAVADLRRNRTNDANTYLYEFSYVGDEETFTTTILQQPLPFRGASHGDDVSYLFYIPVCKIKHPEPPAVGTKDRLTIERMTELWTNFAKTGNPTPSTGEIITTAWHPATKEEFNYLEISDDLKMNRVGMTIADIIAEYM